VDDDTFGNSLIFNSTGGLGFPALLNNAAKLADATTIGEEEGEEEGVDDRDDKCGLCW